MWYLHPDVHMTRRGRINMVLDEGGTLQWSGPSILDALAWLADQDVMDVQLVGEKGAWGLNFWRLPA